MPNKILIIRKLEDIAMELNYLKKLLPYTQKELLSNAQILYFAERIIERIVTSAIDINYHVISDLLSRSPDDYHASFIEMGMQKIIPFSFAERIAQSTGLRNILIHQYKKINYKKFYASLPVAYKDYSSYIKYIEKYITSK